MENLRCTITNQQSVIKELERTVDRLSAELLVANEEKELIEFQLIEKEGEVKSVDLTHAFRDW